MSKRLEHLLFERTTLVQTRFKRANAGANSLLLVVELKALDIVVVFKIFFSALCDVFLRNRLVVSDVYIFQVSLKHLILSIG